MWTFVAQLQQQGAPPPAAGQLQGPPPWCCLKTCMVGGRRACEPPEEEAGCISGVKDATAYTASLTPPPPPPPCHGDKCFSFSADWSSGGAASTFPAPTFGVRKMEAFFYPQDGSSRRNLASCSVQRVLL